MKSFPTQTVLILALLSIALVVPSLPLARRQFGEYAIEARLASSESGRVQVYFDSGNGFSEEESSSLPLAKSDGLSVYRLPLPGATIYNLRFDPIDRDGTVGIAGVRIVDRSGHDVHDIGLSDFKAFNQIQSLRRTGNRLDVAVTPGGNDPQLLLVFDPPLMLRMEWLEIAKSWFQRAADVFAVLLTLVALGSTAFMRRRTTGAAAWLGAAFDPASPACPPAAAAVLLAGLFLAVLGAKFYLIAKCGSDLPYWDEWDDVGAFLLRPYLEGHLNLAILLAPHNEHRVLWERLWNLGLFSLNDRQWDARWELVSNAALHAGTALLLAGLALRALPARAAAGYAVAVALFFGTAVSVDNTLGGVQSAFYFLIIFSILHVGTTLMARPFSWAWWLAPLAGGAALFSMASGLLSAAVILGAVALRFIRDRKLRPGDAWVLAANAALVFAGWRLQVHVAVNDDLMATSIWTAAEAWLYQLAWPVNSPWAAGLGLLPPLALGASFVRRRVDGPFALTLIAGGAWVWLQAAAIAHVRGHYHHGLESRYEDILAIGVLLNLLIIATLATHAASPRGRSAGVAITLGFAAAVTWGLACRNAVAYEGDLQFRPIIAAARTDSVRNYVVSHDPVFFKKTPWRELPYSSAQRLAEILDTPVIRAALPSSVRPPVPLVADASSLKNFIPYSAEGTADPAPLGLAAWTTADPGRPAHFSSGWFAVDHTRVSLYIAGTMKRDGFRLRMTDQAGRAAEPLDARLPPGSRWKRINFVVSKGSVRFDADVTGGGRFAFTQPFTDTGISRFAKRIADEGPALILLGVALGLGAFLSLRRSR